MRLLSVFCSLLIMFACFNSYAELNNSDMVQVAYNKSIQKADIDQQLEKLNDAISTIQNEIKKNKQDKIDISSEIKDLEVKQKKLEKQLKQELDNFNQAATSLIRFSQVPSEMIVLQDALQVQQKRDGALLIFKQQLNQDIRKSKKSLSDLIANIEDQKSRQLEIKHIEKQLESKKYELLALRKQQQVVLRLPEQIRNKMKADAVLLAKDLDLDKFLSRVKTSKVKVKTVMTDENMPVQGKIVKNFGDPDRITELPVQGITVDSFSRGKIKAIHDGRVIYSGVFREYGHLVILEHQTGAHSLYAGFGKAIVDVGDYVNAGNLMGFLPAEEEPSFYYEVRINNIAVDPKQWLTKDLNQA